MAGGTSMCKWMQNLPGACERETLSRPCLQSGAGQNVPTGTNRQAFPNSMQEQVGLCRLEEEEYWTNYLKLNLNLKLLESGHNLWWDILSKNRTLTKGNTWSLDFTNPQNYQHPVGLLAVAVGRVLHQYHRGHGFDSGTSLNFFRLFLFFS